MRCSSSCLCIVTVNSFMRFNLQRLVGEEKTRQMVLREDKSFSAFNVWGAPAIHPPSHLHSLSVWPYPTCMTPNHSSSLYPSITPVTSCFHFSAPRPELFPPVTGDTIWVDYLGFHDRWMVKNHKGYKSFNTLNDSISLSNITVTASKGW